MAVRYFLLALSVGLTTGCSSAGDGRTDSNTGGASGVGGSSGSTFDANGGGGFGGASAATGGTATIGTGGTLLSRGTGGTISASGGARARETDASVDGAASPRRMVLGVNVHDYPKPTAYGFTAADGKDRMGSALETAGIATIRGATIGDTTFFQRLATFGVKEVVLGLSASAHGKPFDPSTVASALETSLTAARAAGLSVEVEGLNEWDLFNSKPYNAGVLPAGMTASEFVLFTQKALYEAAHPLGLEVLGPSVGHAADFAFFPDVSPYVDVVNAHLYFTSSPETLALATLVHDHEQFEGSGKPFWVTETGISSYGAVTTADQADVIRRGLGIFGASGLIQRTYIYELLDDQLPGLSGTTYTPDDAEYHFGLFTFQGDAKPAAQSVEDFILPP